MMKLFCRKKTKNGFWGALAMLAVLLPSIVFAANPVLDPAGAYQVGNKSIDPNWHASTTASPGQTVSFLVHVHNGANNTQIQNVKVSATLPIGAVPDYTSTATVSGNGVSSVSGQVNIHLTESAKLVYVPGSTVMYNHMNQLEANLPDGITSGGITVLPVLNGCWEYERWIIFKANVVEQPKPEKVRIHVVKFNDLNSNGVQDAGEAKLAGWQFKVTGPENYMAVIVTDSNGEASLSDLKAGNYTVTEIGKDGWVSTTPATVTKDVSTDPNSQEFVFGNRQKNCNELNNCPTNPTCEQTGTCAVNPPTNLPTSGPGEMFGMILGAASISGGTLSYIRSKKNLKKATRR